jgi:hypothetical protein
VLDHDQAIDVAALERLGYAAHSRWIGHSGPAECASMPARPYILEPSRPAIWRGRHGTVTRAA